jgi:hypothetical protein
MKVCDYWACDINILFNYWAFGLLSSTSILKNTTFRENGSVRVVTCDRWETLTTLSPFEWAIPSTPECRTLS